MVLNTNNTVTISCSGDAGSTYWMQAATNLAQPGSWISVSTNVAGTNGTWRFTNGVSASCPDALFPRSCRAIGLILAVATLCECRHFEKSSQVAAVIDR